MVSILLDDAVRVAAAHDHRIDLPGQGNVVRVAALALHQLGVFVARYRLADGEFLERPRLLGLSCTFMAMPESVRLRLGDPQIYRRRWLPQGRGAHAAVPLGRVAAVFGLCVALRRLAAVYTGRDLNEQAAAVEPLEETGFGGGGKASEWTAGPGKPAASPCARSLARRRRAPGPRRLACGHVRDGAGDRGGATYAALDLGTNNCRLLVARPAGDSFRVIDAFSRIIRLGEGVSGVRQLSDAAMARAIDALAVCRRQDAQPRRHPRAADRDRSLPRRGEWRRVSARGARAKLGLELEIIDRETEAALAATGCTPLIDPGAARRHPVRHRRRLLRAGAAWAVRETVRRGPPRPHIESWVSLPVGVVTLAERHGGVTVTRELFETMVEEVAGLCRRLRCREHGDGLDGLHLLGTSGTVTTIAGVHLDLPRYDRRRVDGCWMSESRSRPAWSSGCVGDEL